MREMNEQGCKKCKRTLFFTASSSFSLVLDFPLKPENLQSKERNKDTIEDEEPTALSEYEHV